MVTRLTLLAISFFLPISVSPAPANPVLQHNISVHVIEARSGKPLPHITVNLRLGCDRGRKSIQQATDTSGIAYFDLPSSVPGCMTVDAFSVRYHATKADPQIMSIPSDVTISVQRLGFFQSLNFLLWGD